MIYATANQIVRGFTKGSFHSITWNKRLKTRKGINVRVEKVSKASAVRFGINYSHLDSVKERNGVGQDGNAKTQSPSWWEWIENQEMYFAENVKDKSKIYLRVTLSKNTKVETKYYADGVEITKEEARKLCPSDQFSDHKYGEVFNVTVDHITQIK